MIWGCSRKLIWHTSSIVLDLHTGLWRGNKDHLSQDGLAWCRHPRNLSLMYKYGKRPLLCNERQAHVERFTALARFG